MIEIVMFVALGFTLAGLLALFIAPAAWRRAVRLTTRRLEATLPISLKDINADKDLLRAESAVEIRRLELALEQAKERAARHLMERNLSTVEIGKLESGIASLKRSVMEKTRAGEVLEQTVRRRIPDLEAQLAQAGQLIAARERELASRAVAIGNHKDAMDLSRKMLRQQEQEIDRLRAALEDGAGGRDNFWSKAVKGGEARAAQVRKIGVLEAYCSRLREELALLRAGDVADAAELRAEMLRLADLMLGGTAQIKPETAIEKPGSGPAPPEPAKDKEAGSSAAEEVAVEKEKSHPAAEPRVKHTTGRYKSLSDRLAGFRSRKEKESV